MNCISNERPVNTYTLGELHVMFVEQFHQHLLGLCLSCHSILDDFGRHIADFLNVLLIGGSGLGFGHIQFAVDGSQFLAFLRCQQFMTLADTDGSAKVCIPDNGLYLQSR